MTPNWVIDHFAKERRNSPNQEVRLSQLLNDAISGKGYPPDLRPNSGWQLHFQVSTEDVDQATVFLKRNKWRFRAGTEFTVYAGHKDVADYLATVLNEALGIVLRPLYARPTLKQQQLAKKVVGTFEAEPYLDFQYSFGELERLYGEFFSGTKVSSPLLSKNFAPAQLSYHIADLNSRQYRSKKRFNHAA